MPMPTTDPLSAWPSRRALFLMLGLALLQACATPAGRDDAPPAAAPVVEPAPEPPAVGVAPEPAPLPPATEPATPSGDAAARAEAAPEPPRPARLRIVAVGDIMLGTDFPADRLPPEGQSLLDPVAGILRDADLTIGNLEGTLLDGGQPFKQCANPERCYLFRTPGRFRDQLAAAGFDVMSLANNHARDFGEEGRSSSMAQLDAVGIAHTGREGDVASVEAGGLRVAVIGYAPFAGAHSMHDLDGARARIAELAATHDLVFVSVHGGAEGEEWSRLPFKREFFHGEDRGDMVRFSRLAIDAGADLVLGHGPHVPRAVELYRDRLIAYSLGNFATHWGISIRGRNGIAPILRVEIDRDGRFLEGRIVSARQDRESGTVPDASHAAARIIAELTRLDFPATPLAIDPAGVIRRTD